MDQTVLFKNSTESSVTWEKTYQCYLQSSNMSAILLGKYPNPQFTRNQEIWTLVDLGPLLTLSQLRHWSHGLF